MSDKVDIINERLLMAALKFDSHEAFSVIFRQYYADLVMFAGTFFAEQADCEDIVQNVFVKLWNERRLLDIRSSLRSYLLKLVQNSCLDELRRRRVRLQYQTESHRLLLALTPEDWCMYTELSTAIDRVMEQMPAECREVLTMSRIDNMKQIDIAARLNVSVRTVEARMSRAVRFLRTHLTDFYVILFVIINSLI